MRRARRLLLVTLAVVAGLAGLVVAAWAVDANRSETVASRNVTVAGHPVGGLDRARLAAVVDDVARAYGAEPVQVDAPGGGFDLGPGEIGLTVDRDATVAAVMRAGRTGGPLTRITGWVASFVHARRAAVAVRVDRASVYRVVADRDTGRTAPTEPSMKLSKGALVAVDGTPGRGIDPAAVLAALPAAAGDGAPIRVHVERGPVPPRYDMVDVERVIATAEASTLKPLAVTVDGHSGVVPVATLRSWLSAQPTDAGLHLAVNTSRASTELGTLFPDEGTPAVETTFTVVDNVPQIVPGTPGTACCGPDAGAQVDAALQARIAGRTGAEPISLPLKARPPALSADDAAALGVKEVVGTFTTNHAPGQPRVSNIHLISDLVRGQVILPGKTFSVNAFVGKRTAEKGFLVDHVIEDGKFTESVGGGISQFATTTFNAAFFAGMEFPEYQAHSLYISRYPYGREATLSYPHPDLKVRNPSPYGVLIWPTYTDRSVTVTLYSTKWVTATQSNQTKEQLGPCTRVHTERTRVFLDGTTKVDSVGALYHPAEGVDCP